MPVQEFTCPHCGAPVEYEGQDTPTVHCRFCNTSVMVPPELRPKHRARSEKPVSSSKGGTLGFILIAAFIVFIVGITTIPSLITDLASRAIDRSSSAADDFITRMPGLLLTMQPANTDSPQEPATAAPTRAEPTASFAQRKVTFGSKGIGLGMLNDARYMTVDGSGTVYVADYQGGRIQAFDSNGKFLHMWQVGDENTIIEGLAANHAGVVWAAYAGDIYRYDGASGKLLDKVAYPNGPEFGDLAATPDGGLVGVWYEGRWGLITSLEGHREDLAWFDANGNPIRTLPSFISGQTENLALDAMLAVDGLGTIYAASEGEIFKFTSQGKFVTRFSGLGDPSASVFSVDSITADDQGQIYASTGDQISVFSPDGRLLKSFTVDFSADKIAFNEKGELYVLSRDQVAIYSLSDLP